MFKQFTAVCCLCLVALTAQAADLVELYTAALESDPALRSVEYEGGAAEELHTQSLANFLPNVTAQYQTQKTKQKILRSDNAVFGQGSSNFPTTNWTASLTQPVFHLDSWYAYSQTELGEMRAATELSVARQDLMVRLVEAYLAALEAEEDHALAVAEKDTLKSELELAQVKYANGLLSVSDLRDVEARSAELDALVLSSQAAVQDALEVIRGMVGVSVKALTPLRKDAILPEMDAASIDEQVSQALENNYAVQSSKLAVAIAEKEIDRLSAQHYPTVDLIARYNRRDTKGSLFGGGSEVDSMDVILQVDVPIYSGGRTQSQKRESIYRSEQAKQDLEAARRSVARDIRSGYVNLLSSAGKISALQHSLEAKRSLNELKREGHRAGINSMLEKLEAQRDFYIAERDLVAARYDHLLNYVKIKQASGTLEGGDLEKVNMLLAGESVAVSSYEHMGSTVVVDSPPKVPLVVKELQPEVQDSAAAEAEPPVAVAAESVTDVQLASVDAETAAAEAVSSQPEQTQTVIEAIEDWRQKWSGRDVDEYFSYYAPNFTPASGSLESWAASKRRNLGNKKYIRIVLNNVEVEELEAGKRAKVSFLQYYRSDSFVSKVVKTLELELHGNRWLIVSETVD